MNFDFPEDKKGKYWRKEKLNGKSIVYGNVDQRRKKIFDKAFNEMINK